MRIGYSCDSRFLYRNSISFAEQHKGLVNRENCLVGVGQIVGKIGHPLLNALYESMLAPINQRDQLSAMASKACIWFRGNSPTRLK